MNAKMRHQNQCNNEAKNPTESVHKTASVPWDFIKADLAFAGRSVIFFLGSCLFLF